VGSRVLVVLTDLAQARLAFALAARIAAADGGVVHGMLAAPPGAMDERESHLAELQAAGYAVGIDVEPHLLVHDALADSVVNAATEGRASLVVLGASTSADASPFGSDAEAITAGLAAPVAVLLGSGAEPREVEVVREPQDRPSGSVFDADGLAVDLGRRIAGAAVETGDLVPESLEAPRPGLLRIMPATSWQLLAGTAEPGSSSAVLLLLDL
jgi:hypothetical protein